MGRDVPFNPEACASPSIRPNLEFVGRQNRGATVSLRIDFDDFDKAMQFNATVIEWLVREIPRADIKPED